MKVIKVKVKVTGVKTVENMYSHKVKLQSAMMGITILRVVTLL